ncbi:MAG TPA: ABC transporter permease [Methanocellales archaeon]|nr:ABC transporter permease [Methanocellales archaeon]
MKKPLSNWSFDRVKQERIFTIFLFLGLVLVAFVFITLGNMFYQQLEDISGLIAAATDPVVLKAIGISISMALVSTLVAFFFGVPLAYFLARKEFTGKSIIEGLVDVPLMIPHVVAGIALYGVFMRHGLIGAPLRELGIVITDAYPGIVIAMLFMSLPYLVDTAIEGFKEVDPRLENVARSLGASQWKTFREITFPLAFSSILSGAILSWGRAISEFSAVLILAYHPISAPILIYEKFTSFGLRASRPISVLLILICLVIFILLRVSQRRRK